ncbi:hypothetical protein EB796_016391 [Bugula neritina]|uniref:C2 domain-containing protein n=1 Tax=Bugula neritina TaxID=10212 RepID=A0A7J7JIF8_BUGNE|nr:hypothetical protein EB796_016391 [Bugula neritina]
MALSLAKMLKKTVRGDSASNVSQVATFSTADSATEMSDESTDTSSTLENVEPEFLHPYSTKCKQTCLERVIRPSKHNYPQDFQVSISIIEIRKLQGLNLNPMVEIHVGDVKKKTSSKESTNCPFFDEYFVFDYHLPKQSVLEKIVTFTVFSVATFTKGKPLCQLKVELAAIYAFPGHQVYHKWAPLMSCDDQGSEDIQGYMKIDIAITGKDSARPTADVCQNSADENFDKACERKTLNLLLPPGCGQFDRQKAKIHVKIYKAEDLPFMNIGILANMKKAFTGEKPDLVDPYVQVSFAGVMYKTSVKKGQCSPVWNEQLTFTEALPALCSTINIKLKDKASVTDDVIGIYHIDLMEISNTGTTGFLPTFGPCWVNLYGSKREVNVLNEHRALNSSQGEGIAYRGRLLVAVSTEPVSGFTIVDETSANEPADEITRIPAVPEAVLPKKGDFLLAGAVLEATMINPKYKNQAIQFELSIGNLEQTFEAPEDQLKGVTLRRESVIKIPVFDSHDKTPLIDSQQIDPGVCSEFTNISAPRTPKTNDKRVYSINYGVEKPCLYVQTRLEDTTARMHSQNLSDYLAEYLSNGIADVKSFLSYGDMEKAVTRLTAVAKRFAVLCISCSNIWSIHPNSSTKLDRERGRVCKLKLENLSSKARTIRNTLTYNTIKTKIRQCLEMLTEVRALAEEPQGTFPDVFIWMIVGGKRVAYFRLLARDILYTPETELPGKKSAGAGGWQMQAQLSMILWLGCLEDKESFLENLPPGYRSRYADIPRSLTCSCEDVYQFRAHLYQARALIGSDNSGLSDPYAVVKFGEHSVVTKTIYETLSPTWNQMLLINNISLPYTAEYMKINPPIITIELYDEDNIGGPEFLGRTFAFPLVKLSTDKYEGPTFPALLQWWHIRRGQSPSGELLASFELFQKPFDPTEIYQLLLTPQPEKKRRKNALGGLPFEVAPQDIAAALSSEQEAITPIPGSIRPVYSKHRIEVMFWGVRELKKLQFMSVNRPRVDVECAGHVISSVPITDANVNPNFSVTVMHTDVELPDDETYCPPITIRCVDCRNFGRFVLVGTHTIRSLQKYLYHPKSKDSFDNLHIKSPSKLIEGTASEPTISRQAVTSKFGNLVQSTILQNTSSTSSGLKNLGQEIASKTARTPLRRSQSQVQRDELDEIDWSSLDWWSKYYASVDKLEIYDRELEAVKEFEGFAEWLHTFNFYRGKKIADEEDEESRLVGKFKGCLQIYKNPPDLSAQDVNIVGGDPKMGMFSGMPANSPVKVLVRIYIVLGKELHPADMNGKADPYLIIKLGQKVINDIDNYVPKNLNPIFGRCFEQEVTFPMESQLCIQVMDWDMFSKNDLIGETKIDLENRYYSRHRATCGLNNLYHSSGYNAWRDRQKPSLILAKLCTEARIDPPHYRLHQSKVTVANREFYLKPALVSYIFKNCK